MKRKIFWAWVVVLGVAGVVNLWNFIRVLCRSGVLKLAIVFASSVSAMAFDVRVTNHTTNNIAIGDRVVMAGQGIVISDFGANWSALEYLAPACGPVSLPVTNRCHVVITVCDPQVLTWESEMEWFSAGWQLGVLIFGFYWLLNIVKRMVHVSPEGV